jgi:hypothetical protein
MFAKGFFVPLPIERGLCSDLKKWPCGVFTAELCLRRGRDQFSAIAPTVWFGCGPVSSAAHIIGKASHAPRL